uniref:Uncharacterized protein n=1 Tax=Branchiostoma floridae TaxID=7739 RepID=C3XQZ5_BRAFL|eukprot:XP_002613581.1 hypothetical protein BRAFLDRAFT_71770 [Branchiostoma floridae]
MTNLKKLTIVLGRKPEVREEEAKEVSHLPGEGLKLVRCSQKRLPGAPPNTPATTKETKWESNLDFENPMHKAKKVRDRGERWLVDVVESDRVSDDNREGMRVRRANILPRLALPPLSPHFMIQHHICQRYLTHASSDTNTQFPGITRSNSIVRRPKIARSGELRSLWVEGNETGPGLFLSRYRDGPTAKGGSDYKKRDRGVGRKRQFYYETGRSSLAVLGTKKEIEGPGREFYLSPAHGAQSMYQRSLMRNWAKFCRM